MHSKRKLAKALAAAGLAVAMTTGIALASIGTGTVTASNLRLRSEANTTSDTLAYAPRNTQVTLLEEVSDGWYKVTYDGTVGYMSADWLDVTLGEDNSAVGSDTQRVGTVTADVLNVRAGAGTVYNQVGTLSKGDTVTILDDSISGWYKISCGAITGYVSSEYIAVDQGDEEDAPETDVPEDNGSAETVTGTVNADTLNVRSGAGTSYSRVGTLTKGDTVTILDDSISGWYKISYGSITGYVSSEYISTGDEEVEPEPTPEPQKGIVTASSLNVRAGAGTSYERVGIVYGGGTVTILDDSISGWYKISCGSIVGYVSSQYISIVGSNSSSSLGAAAVAMAQSLLGCRYVYGAAGPNSFDCSGLFYYIFRQLGHPIARGSSSQYYNSGYFVSTSEMQPGDLLYFFDPKYDGSGGTLPTTHVGMYVGGDTFIHASTTSYRVQYDNLFSGYYGKYLVAVKRIG